MECNQIHSFYPKEETEKDEEEDMGRVQRKLDDSVEEQRNLDKPTYFIGNNEMLNIFNQKCVICFVVSSLYAFRQCGHQ